MKKLNLLFVTLFTLIQCNLAIHAQETNNLKYKNQDYHQAYIPKGDDILKNNPVKNVILMIGDGMGLAHLASGMYANHNELSITNISTIGLIKTQSGDKFTTDSAASGTAYATGQKTHNGAIGVDMNDALIKNIPEIVTQSKFVAGVVTTDNISGATPSAFFAHQKDRGMSKEILTDLPKSKLSFIAGGSDEHFMKVYPQYKQILAAQDFIILNDYKEVSNNLRNAKIALIAFQKDVDSKQNGRGEFLPKTTKKAIEFLNNKKATGFFLMVEGAQIDKRAHENNFAGVIQEVLDFDKAVAEAIAFADKDKNTLVIVTADHETGGLSIKKGDIAQSSLEGNFSSKGHTPIMVPIFAYGPSSDNFKGVMENNEVMKKIISVLIKQK